MPTVKISAYKHTCTRCNSGWNSFLESPAACSICKSPYWNVEKKVSKYQAVRELAVGSEITFPWNENHIIPQSLINAVDKLNKRGGSFTIAFKADGAHITRAPDKVSL